MLIRAITALLGVSLLWLIWHFFAINGLIAVCSVVTFIACTEFSTMVEPTNRLVRSLFTCISFAFYLTFSFYSQSFIVFLSFFILLVGYFILATRESIESRVNNLAAWTVGVLYCGIFTGVVNLGLIEFDEPFFLSLLLISFLTDTFAYLGGRLIGKNRIAPRISPKKTIEGSVVGLIGGSGFGFWYLSSLNHSSPTWLLIVVCLVGSMFNQIGDLFESMLKRYSGVKDSGKIMPGHGGILDRIDGLLFVGPVLYLWMQFYL